MSEYAKVSDSFFPLYFLFKGWFRNLVCSRLQKECVCWFTCLFSVSLITLQAAIKHFYSQVPSMVPDTVHSQITFSERR
jgi:hypothetical protein